MLCDFGGLIGSLDNLGQVILHCSPIPTSQVPIFFHPIIENLENLISPI